MNISAKLSNMAILAKDDDLRICQTLIRNVSMGHDKKSRYFIDNIKKKMQLLQHSKKNEMTKKWQRKYVYVFT